jgi:hypothetical protein
VVVRAVVAGGDPVDAEAAAGMAEVAADDVKKYLPLICADQLR